MQPPTFFVTPLRRFSVQALIALAVATAGGAQQISPPKPVASSTAPDEAIVLSPFEVSASSDVGYQARETIAGGRLRTELKDVSSQVDVMTQEFISDLGLNTLDEALKYSLSVESENDFYSVGGTGTLTANPFSPDAGNRARGLGRASASIGFFETTTPIDSYNTERYTFVNGPNAILFGNGLAGGSIDTSFKRAQTNLNKYSTSLQIDSDRGYRASVDLNQILKKDLLAVRFNGMKQDTDFGRTPSYDRQERTFTSVSLDPFKKLRVRAYYENGDLQKQPVRATLVQDKVTPYLNTLSPDARARFLATYDPSVLRGFDNSALNSFSVAANNNATNPALVAQGFAPAGQTALATRYATVQPVLVSGGAGSSTIPVMSWNNTAQTANGPGSFLGDTTDWSFRDSEIFPAEINIFGRALQNHTRSRIYGGVIELSPAKNLYVEYGYNRERFNMSYVDYLSQGNAELLLDLNRFLPVTVASGPLPARVPNPNYGRYYVTSGISTGEAQNEREDHRLTATYELDFAKNKGWSRWLGTHRLLGMWTSQMNQRFEQVRAGSSGRVISDNDFTPTAANVDLSNASRTLQMRHYLGSPTARTGGAPFVDLPYDPWNPGTVGKDASGQPVILGGNNLPWGRSNPVQNGRKETDGRMFSLQSALLGGRIVGNLGLRSDKNTDSPWLAANLQPRYDATTGKFVKPTAPVTAASPLNTAPYAPWRNFYNYGFDQIIDPARVQHEKPTSKLKGVVVHPLRWLSLFYNQSTSAYAAEFARTNLDGSSMALDDGTGKDYGLAVSILDGRLSLRVNQYENIRTGALSSYRDNSGTGQRSMRDTIYHVEKTYLIVNPGFRPSGPFAFYQDQVQQLGHTITATTNFTGTSVPLAANRDQFDTASNKLAKGTEVTLSANPFPGWFLSFRGAKNRTVETNVGQMWFDYILSRVKDWETIANVPMYAIDGQVTTIRTYFQNVMLPSMSYIKMVDGLPNPQERRYRMNFTARYSFQREPLKGFYVGGNYNWRSKAALGLFNRPATQADVITTFAGVGAGNFQVPDFNQMIYSRALTSLDAFAGYRRRIFGGKYEWQAQLNIRNLFDDRELIAQRSFGYVGPNGNQPILTNFNLPDPRRFIFTNTITF
jgi:hypothetical protein